LRQIEWHCSCNWYSQLMCPHWFHPIKWSLEELYFKRLNLQGLLIKPTQ
jgi:hypothetical protein